MRRILAGLLMLMAGASTAWAGEAFSAKIGGHEVLVPFPEGVEKQSENAAAHSASYRFMIVDRTTSKPKLDLSVQVFAYAPAEKNAAQAKKSIQSVLQQAGLKIPASAMEIAEPAKVNPALRVYWAPFYYLGTGKPEKPYMVYKPTIVTSKDSAVAISFQMMGFLIGKDAAEKDMPIAEKIMEQLLLSLIQGASAK